MTAKAAQLSTFLESVRRDGAVMAPSVTRALQAIKRYAAAADQIDHAVLSAINVTLYVRSGGDDRVSEGFNRDLAGNGRDFGRRLAT
jgi:hypothetical protein